MKTITYIFSVYGPLEVQQNRAAIIIRGIIDIVSDNMFVWRNYIFFNISYARGIPPEIRKNEHSRPKLHPRI